MNILKRALTTVVLACVCTALANTYYVDGGAGSDSNNGTATNTAWLHIPGTTNLTGSGWVRLVDGDTLWMKGGTSNIMVMLNTTWYLGSSLYNSIQLRSGHLRSPQWGTTRAIVDSANTYHSGFWIGNNTNVRGVTVDGFEVRNIAGGGVGIGFDPNSGSACIDIGGSTSAGYITIRNCYLHDAIRTIEDTGHGVEISRGDHYIIEKNDVGPNIGTKGIESFLGDLGVIRYNYILAGTDSFTGDHGIALEGNNWDVYGNLVSVHDGVHQPIYGIKIMGNVNDIWNNVVFGRNPDMVDIGGIYVVPPIPDGHSQCSSNRIICNTVYRLHSTGNFCEEGQSLVIGLDPGSGNVATNTLVQNNLLTFSTNAFSGGTGFDMNYEGNSRKSQIQFNDFFSAVGGFTISMGRSSCSNFTVANWQALTFDTGTTNANNVQVNPVYTGGTLPSGMNTSFQPNQSFFVLTSSSPSTVTNTSNSFATAGNSQHGYDANPTKFVTDILGTNRVNWSMGAYEFGGAAPQLTAPLLTVSGRFTLTGSATLR